MTGKEMQEQELVNVIVEYVMANNPKTYNGDDHLVSLFEKFAKDAMRDEIIGAVEQVMADKFVELTSDPFLLITEKNNDWVEWHLASSLAGCINMAKNNLEQYKDFSPKFTIYQDRMVVYNNDNVLVMVKEVEKHNAQEPSYNMVEAIKFIAENMEFYDFIGLYKKTKKNGELSSEDADLIYDLLEDYGAIQDLPENWWMNEVDSELDVVMLFPTIFD